MPNPSVALIATHDYPYGPRRLHAGDHFEATPKDAEFLLRIKRARLAGAVKGRYKRKDLRAEE